MANNLFIIDVYIAGFESQMKSSLFKIGGNLREAIFREVQEVLFWLHIQLVHVRYIKNQFILRLYITRDLDLSFIQS